MNVGVCRNIYIGCTAGGSSGLGHLMRTLTIAKELSSSNVNVIYINNNFSIKVKEIISQYHFEVITYSAFLKKSTSLSKHENILLLDVNDINIAKRFLKKFTGKSVVFDDNYAANELCCDVVFNNNLWADPLRYKNISGRKIFVGGKYNTIEKSYFNIINSKTNKNILITMGGQDPFNDTLLVVRALYKFFKDYAVYVCIGPFFKNKKELVSEIKSYLENVIIINSPSNLYSLIVECDYAITAGGTTCYQLSAAGKKFLIIPVEKHQISLAKSFQDKNLALASLSKRKNKLIEFFIELTSDLYRPQRFSKSSGVTNVIKQILS